jgi:tight adherence protein B
MLDLTVFASAFLFVLSLWAVGVWLWSLRRSSRTQQVERRLGALADENASARELRLWHDGREVTTSVSGDARRASFQARLQQLREDAGWRMPLLSMALGVAGLTTLLSLATFVLTGRLLAGVGVGAVVLIVFWIYAKHRVVARAAVFERQFVDALELAARSLRAGHPLVGGFILASEEIPAPVGRVFAEICQQQDLGVSLEDALRGAANASANADMKLFATSVIIQLESGGNLADMMEQLAVVIRDRIKLNRLVRVLTSQTQLSKRILVALPFILFLLLNALNPAYMEPLYTTSAGKYMLIGGAVSLLLGVWAMGRLVILRY